MSITEAKMAEQAVVAWLTDHPDVIDRIGDGLEQVAYSCAEFAGLDSRARLTAITHPWAEGWEALIQDAAVNASRCSLHRFPENPAFWRLVVPTSVGTFLAGATT